MATYKRKNIYQNGAVAEAYFDSRFSSPKGKKENEATKLALERALNSVPGAKIILDMPCGSGRFTSFLPRSATFVQGLERSGGACISIGTTAVSLHVICRLHLLETHYTFL